MFFYLENENAIFNLTTENAISLNLASENAVVYIASENAFF